MKALITTTLVTVLLALTTGCASVGGVSSVRNEVGKLDSLAKSLAKKIRSKGGYRVALVDFNVSGSNNSNMGRFVSEQISVALSSGSNGIQVIDKTHLEKIVKERKNIQRGRFDFALELGRISGADTIIVGTITKFGNYHQIQAKALNVRNAVIIAAETKDLDIARLNGRYSANNNSSFLRSYGLIYLVYIVASSLAY